MTISESMKDGSAPDTPSSDALVFFGATGDLAHKKIFPALQALAKHGMLDIPVIGVAKAGWTLDQLRARARDSVERYGGLERDAFSRLSRLMDYVDGDYGEAVTFQELRRKLGNAKHPTHYLAIPPAFFGTVPVHEYERGTWGLPQASALIEPDGGWFDPPPPATLKAPDVQLLF